MRVYVWLGWSRLGKPADKGTGTAGRAGNEKLNI